MSFELVLELMDDFVEECYLAKFGPYRLGQILARGRVDKRDAHALTLELEEVSDGSRVLRPDESEPSLEERVERALGDKGLAGRVQ